MERMNDEVHVFHRDRAEQHLITRYQSATKGNAIFEAYFHWSHVRNRLPTTIGEHCLLATIDIFQSQSLRNVGRYTQKRRTGVS